MKQGEAAVGKNEAVCLLCFYIFAIARVWAMREGRGAKYLMGCGLRTKNYFMGPEKYMWLERYPFLLALF